MNLSKKAKTELKKILSKEIGPEKTGLFSDAELNDLGVRLLGLTSIILKRKINKKEKVL